MNLSGIETQAGRALRDNDPLPVVSDLFQRLSLSILEMTQHLSEKYDVKNFIYMGGVSASSYLRDFLSMNINPDSQYNIRQSGALLRQCGRNISLRRKKVMALRPVTVSQLNEYISRVLSTDPLLGNISVTGEISNLKFHGSGHVYFSLIDGNSKVNCFLPSSYAENLSYAPGDGLEVTVQGYINVYKKGGTYTLFVKNIEVSGEGNLSMAFDILKKKLDKEGIFDKEHKKPIPKFPKKLGVVTSETGAAVRDIIKIIKSRTRLTDVTVFPVLVQGQKAAADIAGTLDMINEKFPDIDVLIVGRGGGSSEDLWAFNEEMLARAVYRSEIPIISAVGHEIDITICDFAADMRAETPTAAAEMAVPDDGKLREDIELSRRNLLTQLKNKTSYYEMSCGRMYESMKNSIDAKLKSLTHMIEQKHVSLEENNPRSILSKGYAILEESGGKVVASVKKLEPLKRYKIYLKDGCVEFTISDLKEGESYDF